MNDIFLITAGVGGAMIALVHGYLGQTKVLPSFAGSTPPLRRVNLAVFQLSTVYWLVGGVALICAAVFLGGTERKIVVAMVSFLYIAGAVGNFWATRGRHPGWFLLGLVTVLAIIGA